MSRKAIINDLLNAGLITDAQAGVLDTVGEINTGSDFSTTYTQGTAVADAAGGATHIDVEARSALNDLLAELRTLNIIAT